MAETQIYSRLLDLPWEIRRPIIIEVLRTGRKSEPAFSRKLIKSRVRLSNCFDKSFPEVTNLYVPRRKNLRLHGNALRATNRQLRYETNQLIEEEFKSGNIKILFILDVMIVKDIGVFPTWMSFPYRPEHLKMLTINLRIIRPGISNLPNEWIEVARYEKKGYSYWDKRPTDSNIIMAIVFYALGCFSVKPDPTQPSVKRNNQPAIATISTKQQATQLPKPNTKKSKFPIQPNLIDHQIDVLNAYLLSSASYVTDELFIDFKGPEYDVNNRPIPPEVKDSPQKSPFYREGYAQFSREIFVDYSSKWKDSDERDYEERLISRGEYACYQLEQRLGGILCNVDSTEEAYFSYLTMLARSVRELKISGCENRERVLVHRHPGFWADLRYALDDETIEGRYTEAKIAQDLIEEMDHGSHYTVELLRTIQIRRSHGWVNDDD